MIESELTAHLPIKPMSLSNQAKSCSYQLPECRSGTVTFLYSYELGQHKPDLACMVRLIQLDAPDCCGLRRCQ